MTYVTNSQEDLLVKRSTNAKAAIVITKKVAPKAVDRNRIKRIIKEALRSAKIQKGQLQIIVKRNIASLKSYQVKEKIEKFFNNEK
ncbi:ribonuclease P protein component [Candidatus Curtissbacteria bacterium]|nr:ribonuclease P protein component [Candidatus Curtissbacteria bacterium]